MQKADRDEFPAGFFHFSDYPVLPFSQPQFYCIIYCIVWSKSATQIIHEDLVKEWKNAVLDCISTNNG